MVKHGGNNVLRTFGYIYDAANNITGKTRTVTLPYSANTLVYAYDTADEQTSVTLNGSTTETRSYDAWGRVASRTRPGTAKAGTDPSALCPPQRARSAWVSPEWH